MIQIAPIDIPPQINRMDRFTASPNSADPSGFAAQLYASDAATDRQLPDQDTPRQAAQQLVAIALVQPLLAQARLDTFQTPMFHGGQAEKMFGAQLDSLIAQQITSRTGLPIVDSVYRHITRQPNPTLNVTNHPNAKRLDTHG